MVIPQYIIAMGNKIVVSFFEHLLKAYYRLFYFFFRIEKRGHRGQEESDRLAAFMALMPMSLLCYCNFLTLLYIIARFLLSLSSPSNSVFYIIAVFVIVSNFCLFFHKKRYLMIKAMFENEDKDSRFRRSFCCVVFIIVSMFTMFVLIAIFGIPWIP